MIQTMPDIKYHGSFTDPGYPLQLGDLEAQRIQAWNSAYIAERVHSSQELLRVHTGILMVLTAVAAIAAISALWRAIKG